MHEGAWVDFVAKAFAELCASERDRFYSLSERFCETYECVRRDVDGKVDEQQSREHWESHFALKYFEVELLLAFDRLEEHKKSEYILRAERENFFCVSDTIRPFMSCEIYRIASKSYAMEQFDHFSTLEVLRDDNDDNDSVLSVTPTPSLVSEPMSPRIHCELLEGEGVPGIEDMWKYGQSLESRKRKYNPPVLSNKRFHGRVDGDGAGFVLKDIFWLQKNRPEKHILIETLQELVREEHPGAASSFLPM